MLRSGFFSKELVDVDDDLVRSLLAEIADKTEGKDMLTGFSEEVFAFGIGGRSQHVRDHERSV